METIEQKMNAVTKQNPVTNKLEQDYSAYIPEDQLVWNILFKRQMTQLKSYAVKEFLDCVEAIGFNENEIPNFEKMNMGVLKNYGWEIEVVKGIIPVDQFFNLLSQKKFPCSAWIRPMSSLDYLEEPDMFHDVFGHLPLLLNPTYNQFFQWIARKALADIHNEQLIIALQRLYWYTIEFGLCKENGELKVYGAGLISSIGETQFAIGKDPLKIAYDLQKVMKADFHTDRYQDHYFVIENLEQLLESTVNYAT
jgi:phenylalanine-4-hydroxylase